jgi:hypothetical protein
MHKNVKFEIFGLCVMAHFSEITMSGYFLIGVVFKAQEGTITHLLDAKFIDMAFHKVDDRRGFLESINEDFAKAEFLLQMEKIKKRTVDEVIENVDARTGIMLMNMTDEELIRDLKARMVLQQKELTS